MPNWWDLGEPAIKGQADQVTEAMISDGAVALDKLGADAVAKLNDMLTALQGTRLLSEPGLAIGTDQTRVAYDELIWSVNGMRYRIAAGEVAFTATTHDITDPDTDPREAVYVLSVAAGATSVTITKGTTAAEDAAVAPSTPAGHVKVGEVLIQHDGSAVFDATTTELDAAHLTVTYTDEDAFVIATL
jgi:hypothetical protein